jgi:DNA polymerase I-like protein with 3'-5' exonuclease and polymerase domains
MNIITTPLGLLEMVDYYLEQPAFAFDVETVGPDDFSRLHPLLNEVTWIAFATEGRTDVIPMGHPNGEFIRWDKPLLGSGQKRLDEGKEVREQDYSKREDNWTPVFDKAPEQLLPGDVFKALKPLLFSDKIKVGHNIKFDLKAIAKYYRGVVCPKPYFDTMMASFIIDNRTKNNLGLAACAERELGLVVVKGVGKAVERHAFSEVAKYAAIDAESTWNLYKVYEPKIKDYNLTTVWGLEMDLMLVLADMELAGANIDETELKNLHTQLEKDLVKVTGEAYKLAGREFHMNSIQEKQQLLFTSKSEGGRGIRPNKTIKIALTPKGLEAVKGGEEVGPKHYSVSAEALEYYREKDPLVAAIMKYQDLNKIMTTYVTPYTGGDVTRTSGGKSKTTERQSLLVNGKVHTNFKSHGAETGRFSSSEPNLQNIPSQGEYGKLIRNLFIAPPGYKLVVADYSQIEPRIIASFSKDPAFVENYLQGGDIYTTIGSRMGVDRRAGKVLVLAMSYGVGPEKIADQIGCTVKESHQLMDLFNDRFRAVNNYRDFIVRTARQQRPLPFVSTVLGRRRYIPELLNKDLGQKSRAERQAFNTVIQGSAADLIKLAMVRAHSCFVTEPEVNVLLTVHDELVTLTPDHLAEDTAEAIRQSMEGVKLPDMIVPLIADIKTVQKWGEAKE